MTSTTKVLVLANETVAGRELHNELKRLAIEGPVELHVVAPALASRVKYFLSDVDGPRAARTQRREDRQRQRGNTSPAMPAPGRRHATQPVLRSPAASTRCEARGRQQFHLPTPKLSWSMSLR